LENIFDIVSVMKNSPANAEHDGTVPMNQLGEGLMVASDHKSLYQFGIARRRRISDQLGI
jgi:hypothetical protein